MVVVSVTIALWMLLDAQPDLFLASYIPEHVVGISPTEVGILAAQMLSRVRCTRTFLLTQPGLAGKIRELAHECLTVSIYEQVLSNSTSVHLNYLKHCTASEVSKWPDVEVCHTDRQTERHQTERQTERERETLIRFLPLGNGAPVQCCPGIVAKWAVRLFDLAP